MNKRLKKPAGKAEQTRKAKRKTKNKIITHAAPAAADVPKRRASSREIARTFDVHAVTVRQWTRDGCPHTKQGKTNVYNEAEVAAWLKANGKTGRVGRPASETSKTLEEARLRKENALADKHEIFVRKARGQLVEADEVRKLWAQASIGIRTAFSQLGATIAPSCKDQTAAEVQRIIDERVQSILHALAATDGVPAGTPDEPGTPGGADVQPVG